MRLALALLALHGTGCAAAARLGSLFQGPEPLDPARPIEVSGGLAGNGYSQGGRRVAEREVEQAVQLDPEARRLWRKGTTYQVMGAVCWAAGTVLLVWPVGQVMWHERRTRTWDWGVADWNLAAGGGVGIGIGFALAAMGSAHHAEAVDVHNDRLRQRSEAPRLVPFASPAAPGGGLLVGLRLSY